MRRGRGGSASTSTAFLLLLLLYLRPKASQLRRRVGQHGHVHLEVRVALSQHPREPHVRPKRVVIVRVNSGQDEEGREHDVGVGGAAGEVGRVEGRRGERHVGVRSALGERGGETEKV